MFAGLHGDYVGIFGLGNFARGCCHDDHGRDAFVVVTAVNGATYGYVRGGEGFVGARLVWLGFHW
jgi:hypothetical protein